MPVAQEEEELELVRRFQGASRVLDGRLALPEGACAPGGVCPLASH
jgi:hypothetical protein